MKPENGSRIITQDGATDKTLFAYVRCSTIEQNESRQLEALKSHGIYKVFVEKASAKDAERPMLQQLLEFLREGDSLYITDFSRLARSVKDLLSITEDLTDRGIKLVSLKENLDTSTPTGRLMLTMIGAINAFEREQLLERQREGIYLAKQAGAYKGRKRVERPVEWGEVYALYISRKITGVEAMSRLGLRRSVFYNFVRDETVEDIAEAALEHAVVLGR